MAKSSVSVGFAVYLFEFIAETIQRCGKIPILQWRSHSPSMECVRLEESRTDTDSEIFEMEFFVFEVSNMLLGLFSVAD